MKIRTRIRRARALKRFHKLCYVVLLCLFLQRKTSCKEPEDQTSCFMWTGRMRVSESLKGAEWLKSMTPLYRRIAHYRAPKPLNPKPNIIESWLHCAHPDRVNTQQSQHSDLRRSLVVWAQHGGVDTGANLFRCRSMTVRACLFTRILTQQQ